MWVAPWKSSFAKDVPTLAIVAKVAQRQRINCLGEKESRVIMTISSVSTLWKLAHIQRVPIIFFQTNFAPV
jgi:hypothetical protein